MSLPANFHLCFICPYIEGYLNPGSSTHVGGAQRQQYLLATRLREEGYNVSFISFEGEGNRYEQIEGFDIWKTLPRTNNPIRVFETLIELFRSVRHINADILYTRGNPPLCILASYCCSILDEPLIYVVANDSNLELAKLPSHHGLFRHTPPKLAYLDAIRRADHVVSQTGYQQDLLQNVFGIRSTVVPNGYTILPDQDAIPLSERNYVLWVGSLDPEQKKPERFLRLAGSLPNIEFRMIGWTEDSEYRKKIIELSEEISNLNFDGFVPPDQVDQYYRRAVALVNTSEYEGFPNTFLEAWRYGVPVVSLRQTLDGILAEENVGYHAGSMEGLMRIVSRLWNNRDEAAETGRIGRQYMTDNYALNTVFEMYTRIFCDVLR